jgi:hypothetical protein
LLVPYWTDVGLKAYIWCNLHFRREKHGSPVILPDTLFEDYGHAMAFETHEDELSRLRREQSKTREDQVFGGLSPDEWDRYEVKEERIRELQLKMSRPKLGPASFSTPRRSFF